VVVIISRLFELDVTYIILEYLSKLKPRVIYGEICIAVIELG
jgi:hypothetical protein